VMLRFFVLVDATVSLSGDANVLELLCLGKSDFYSLDIYTILSFSISILLEVSQHFTHTKH
jgi:hypothetical protein